MAITVPTAMVSMEMTMRIVVQYGSKAWKAVKNILPRTANAAAFGAVDMKAVIEVGAPSYTSGATCGMEPLIS